MTQELVDQVWESDLPSTEKLILLSIAYCADSHDECHDIGWVGLGRMTGLSRRAVSNILSSLETRRIISRISSDGSRKVAWKINIENLPMLPPWREFARRFKGEDDRGRRFRALVARDGEKCRVPGCDCTTNLFIDHIRPISRGGVTDLSNLQLLCSKHNAAKGNRDWHTFLASLAEKESRA